MEASDLNSEKVLTSSADNSENATKSSNPNDIKVNLLKLYLQFVMT